MRQKTRFNKILLLFLMALIALMIIGCNNSHKEDYSYYTVNYTSTEGGMIVGLTEQTVKSGDSAQSVAAVANDGYCFVSWSDGNASPMRIDKNITSNLTVIARFEKCAEKYSVVYEAADGGSISGIEKQLVAEGGNAAEVIAVADEGYEFIGWSDGIDTERREDKNVVANISVKALFRKKSYNVNYFADKGGRIDGATSQTVEHGEKATSITAIPELGYKFVCWSDTGSTDPTRTDKNLTGEINAHAEFAYLRPDGKGVAENPVLINNYTELVDMRFYSYMCYKLNSDIDLAGVEFEPLFKSDYPFLGVLDGAGHSIKNMTVSNEHNAPSLLGCILNGTVENINIVDFRITINNAAQVGLKLIAGAVSGEFDGEMKNVFVRGNIDINSEDNGYFAIGGLAGYCEGSITDCSSEITVNAAKLTTIYANDGSACNIGGMVGVARNINVLSCASSCAISVEDHSQSLNVGGLIGISFVDRKYKSSFDGNTSNINIDCKIANVGGLIAKVQNDGGEFEAARCKASGDIVCIGHTGGIAAYINCLTDGKCILDDCHFNGNIKSNFPAGFVYSVSSSGMTKIENCDVTGKISGPMCAGFCYYSNYNVNFFRCYSVTEISGKVMTAGFIFQLHGGSVKECFSEGTITVTFQASGFIFGANYGTVIQNCCSYSDITITNTDETAETRTFACGFMMTAGFQESIFISDCCYLGKISGHVYTTSSVSGQGSIVAAFIGNIYNDTTVENCHCYFREDEFVKVIATNRTPNVIYIYEYGDLTDIAEMTELLNRNGQNNVWELGEDGSPKLKFAL